jgi:hypothetical protein
MLKDMRRIAAATSDERRRQVVAIGEERKGYQRMKNKAATREEWLAARDELLAVGGAVQGP